MVLRIAFDVDKLRADIEVGRTHAAIAKEYGCSTRAVGEAVRREGIVRPERHLQARHPELGDRAWLQREFVDNGGSLADIGRQFGCDRSTIRYYLVRAGISTRGRATDSCHPNSVTETGSKPRTPTGQPRRSPANWASERPPSDGQRANAASKSTRTEAAKRCGWVLCITTVSAMWPTAPAQSL